MTEQTTWERQAAGRAAAYFRPRSYAQERMLHVMVAHAAAYALPMLSVIAGGYFLQALLQPHLGAVAAWCCALACMAGVEAMKAAALRSSVREWYLGMPGGQMAACALAVGFTAYMALHGAAGVGQQLQRQAQQQTEQAAQALRQEHAAQVEQLRGLQAGLASQRWISPDAQRLLLGYQQQEKQAAQQLQERLRALPSHEQAGDGQGAVLALVLLLEAAILGANLYIMHYYRRVWREGQSGSNCSVIPDSSATMEQQMERQAEQLLASVASRREGAAGVSEQERRFFHMWQAGERNPRTFCQELKMNLQQYKSTKEKLNLL